MLPPQKEYFRYSYLSKPTFFMEEQNEKQENEEEFRDLEIDFGI